MDKAFKKLIYRFMSVSVGYMIYQTQVTKYSGKEILHVLPTDIAQELNDMRKEEELWKHGR